MTNRIEKLDGLRGIFSLMIVVLHVEIYSFARDFGLFVDFFFVLSGFVISYVYDDKINGFLDFKSYIKKRIIRLYPLLFFCVLMMTIVHFFASYFVEINTLYINNIIQPLIFSNSIFVFGAINGIVGPSWSISAEMFSYILFAFVIVLPITKRNKYLLKTLIILISFFFLFQTGYFMQTSNLGFIRGFLGFFVGSLVFYLNKNYDKKLKISEFLQLFLLFLFFALVYFSDKSVKFFTPFFFAFLLSSYINSEGFISRLMLTKPLKYLGKISYSVYLNHHLIYLIIEQIMFDFFNFEINIYTNFIYLILTLSTTIIFSHFTYIYIEVKGGNFLTKILKP